MSTDDAHAVRRALGPEETARAGYHIGFRVTSTAVLTTYGLLIVRGAWAPRVTRLPFPLHQVGSRGALMKSVQVATPHGPLRLWGSKLDTDQELLAAHTSTDVVATGPVQPENPESGAPQVADGPVPAATDRAYAWVRTHPVIAALLALVMVGVVLGAVPDQTPPEENDTTASTGASTEEEEPAAEPMPDLVGVRLDKANSRMYRLEEHHDGVEEWDLSPRDRSVWEPANWKVAQTVPAAGAPMDPQGTVYLFYLRPAELRWFDQHPRMPRFDRRILTERLVRRRALFGPVRELIEYRYPDGRAPRYETRAYRSPDDGPDLRPDPSKEPASEWRPRQRLKEASEYGTLALSSLPPPGTRLRTGQLLTLLVVEKPEPPPEPYSTDNDDYYYYDDDGDDDFNVPGWLCPTRFC